jgi:hypothetical protein
MAANSNPLISLGSLNRLRGSVVIPTYPNLNVTASYLGRQGIGLSLEGDSTGMIPAMTGAVTSPEPYMMVNVTLALLRTQNLATQYKAQLELNSLIGAFTVIPDATVHPNYQVSNAALQSVREMSFAGEDPVWMVTLRGTYYINSALWNLV